MSGLVGDCEKYARRLALWIAARQLASHLYSCIQRHSLNNGGLCVNRV